MFLLVDKPKGITSHDVIGKIRKISGERRVGHAGTLDPNATGLVVVGVGREYTKLLWEKFGKLDKTYIAEITLGEERETDDVEGNIINNELQNKNEISKEQISNILKNFIGIIEQVPPLYSAIKIKGKTAYKYARKGIGIKLKPRKVQIYDIRLLKYKYPILEIETKVSTGTYIRALARDLGRVLGCGAYLSNLRRVQIGNYKVEEGVQLKNLDKDNLSKNYFS